MMPRQQSTAHPLRRMLLALILSVGALASADECAPYRYQIGEPPADAPSANSFLLQIQPPDTLPSYVMGTYHSADPLLIDAWARSTLLMGTVGMRRFVGERDLSAAVVPNAQRLPGDPRLSAYLADQGSLFDRLTEAVRPLGIDATEVDRLQPWFAALLVNQAPAMPESRHQAILDRVLQNTAHVIGLEARFLERFSDIEKLHQQAFSLNDQISLLWEAVCNQTEVGALIERQTDAYATNNVAEFERLGMELIGPDPALADALDRVFVRERNARFWPTIWTAVQSGGAFIAIGNSHLFGPGGVMDQLASMHSDVAIREIDLASLQLTLAAPPALAAWVADWLQSRDPATDTTHLFDSLRVRHGSAGALRARLCPGRNCRVEATYLPDDATIVFADTILARLMGSPKLPGYTLGPGGLEPGGGPRLINGRAYEESLMVRELTRHALYRTIVPDLVAAFHTAFDPPHCLRRTLLHWASIAQVEYLHSVGSDHTAHYFALDSRCPESGLWIHAPSEQSSTGR